ncbi:hypothetical protein CTHBC1_2647 [Acetivibrio thermocellus BC1]|nr:hypothetical protein CTHBC1_2647 [Acetivibrio thermocellus BC1]
MARSRNIKPGFFLNDRLAECEPLARLLFAGLWCIADREGRLEDRPKRIKAEILPYDDCDVDQLLNQLAERGFIIRYEVDSNRYIQVTNFSKHQNPHVREAASIIPPPPSQEVAPEKHHTSTVQAQEKHEPFPADSLKLIPDSLNPYTESISTSEPNSDTTQKSEKPKKTRQLPVFDENTEQYKLALFMRSCILENLPNAKVPEPTPDKLRRWAYDIDLMMRIDCRSPDEIRELMDWAHRDSFWKANILSPCKLREKWDTLVAHKMRDEERNRRDPKEPKSWNTLRQLYQKYQAEERGGYP